MCLCVSKSEVLRPSDRTCAGTSGGAVGAPAAAAASASSRPPWGAATVRVSAVSREPRLGLSSPTFSGATPSAASPERQQLEMLERGEKTCSTCLRTVASGLKGRIGSLELRECIVGSDLSDGPLGPFWFWLRSRAQLGIRQRDWRRCSLLTANSEITESAKPRPYSLGARDVCRE